MKIYFNILMDNLKYYKFIEANIDFINKFFNQYSNLVDYLIDSYSEQINILIKWLQDNPVAPLYIPSLNTVPFKKKQINYQNPNLNTATLQICK
jgi:hypothetical protein